jgi:hypothetical protein
MSQRLAREHNPTHLHADAQLALPARAVQAAQLHEHVEAVPLWRVVDHLALDHPAAVPLADEALLLPHAALLGSQGYRDAQRLDIGHLAAAQREGAADGGVGVGGGPP